MASREPSCLVAELSEVLRGRPHGEALGSGIANAVQTAVFRRAHDLKADPPDADKYLTSFKRT